MSHFNVKGDLQGVSRRQLDFICEVIENKGFKSSEVIIEPVRNPDNNYMANVKRIVIKKHGTTFKMVAKLAPANPMLRRLVGVKEFFKNEHFMYTEVLPKFDQKQKSAGIPESERFKFAKCYGALDEEPNEVILLEDLKESNFGILNRLEPLTNDCVRLVLRNFAIYNALSYAIKYQEPETFASFHKKLAPLLDEDRCDEQAMQFFSQLERHALEVADERCNKVIKGALSDVSKLETTIRKFVKNSNYTVIQQGDAWTNNILFRSENNVPVECLMIDYQMVKLNSPIFDIMYMIFNSTTHSQRLEQFHEYIDHYHYELDKALNYFSLKANLVYPRDRLDAEMKIFGKMTFAACILASSLYCTKIETADNVKESLDDSERNLDNAVVIKDNHSLNNMFRTKIEGLADSFCAFGLLL